MSAQRLSDIDAAIQVRLLKSVPASIPEPEASGIRNAFQAVQAGNMTAVLAIWPDGTWAMLAQRSN